MRQCVTDTPAVDACLGGVRITAPPGVTLDLSFMTPGTLPPGITFTRASTATYFDSTGTMQTAATNAPRWDYNPSTHALNGLLIEEARTNNALNITSWGLFNSTVVNNAGIAPDGTNTFTRVVETAATTFFGMDCLVPIVNAAANRYSLFAKAAERRYLQLVHDDSGSNGVFATFDLLAGTVTQASAAYGTATSPSFAAIQAVGNGVWRCSISSTLPGTVSRTIALLSNSGTPGLFPQYAGSTTNGLLIWGAQLESGLYTTSYIPTTTTAGVVRARDAVTQPVAAWFDQTKGSLAFEYMLEGVVASAFSAPAAFVGANANNDIIMVDEFTTTGSTPTAPTLGWDEIFVSGTSNGTCTYAATPVTAGPVHKGAAAWVVGSGLNGAHNGVRPISFNNAITALPVITTLAIAGPVHFQAQPSLWARRARYWPRVLSNAELQSVTT